MNIRQLKNYQNKIYDESTLSNELNKLVQLNYLAFDPTKTTWQLQGNSMFYGLKKYVEHITNDTTIYDFIRIGNGKRVIKKNNKLKR